MPFLTQLLDGRTVVGALLILAAVAVIGLALGSLRIKGVSLGVAGVLFAGLAFGHFGLSLQDSVLEFVREFGLVLFVYTIGMQVGPGFFASLRRQGLRLSLLAGAVVILGVLTALGLGRVLGLENAALVGVLSGATTNTPSLAAAQQALKELPASPEETARRLVLPGLGYAAAYPFGVVGVILSMLALRLVFRVRVDEEERALAAAAEGESPPLARANLEVSNPNLEGVRLEKVPTLAASGVVVSRIHQGGVLHVPKPDTTLRLGDVLLAVGPGEALDNLRIVVGRESDLDLRALPSRITTRRVIVTRPAAAGRTLRELDFPRRFGVQITRVGRAEVEMGISPGFELQYGDTVLAVGEPEDIERVAAELGDAPKSLHYPHLIPMFLGIALGVLIGSWPLQLPGLPAPVKLGLAGGPLLVAILASRLGRLGPLVWYMPISANYMLREVGIVLFLATVGLKSGDKLLETLLHGPGLTWIACGAAITLLPILLVAVFARALLGLNYLTLCGLLAGSMTDPPALFFAASLTRTEAPALAYVTVYPLTIILRVLAAQVLVLTLGG